MPDVDLEITHTRTSVDTYYELEGKIGSFWAFPHASQEQCPFTLLCL